MFSPSGGNVTVSRPFLGPIATTVFIQVWFVGYIYTLGVQYPVTYPHDLNKQVWYPGTPEHVPNYSKTGNYTINSMIK